MMSAHRPAIYRGRSVSAVGLCLLMVLVSLSAMVPPAGNLSSETPARSIYYTPQPNEVGLNLTSTGVLNVPYNHTFSGGALSVTPMWSEAEDTAARFGIDANTGWNGTHLDTQGIGHGGQLSLATEATLATLTDFETLIETLPGWEGQGPNHNAWNVMPLNGTAVQYHPSTATDGQRVLATQALDGLAANMSGCLASPAESIPAFVSQYNLTVDHWLSFMDDDAAWVEARTTGGSWQVLTPSAAYTNTSSLTGAPGDVWSGRSTTWQQAHFNLDALIPSTATTLEIRFCFQTSPTAGQRAGWFLDNFTLSNLGDLPGAWFHGNMSGDYANNADGRLYIPADLSSFTGPMKIEFWASWDIEGSFSDNLLVYVSVNNGTTWAPVSGIPGLPGNGLNIQGTYYMDESLGWRPISYNIPSGVSGHANASDVMFMFQVTTNYQNGYGGFASSGWEGVAVDDVSVVHRPGTAQEERLQLSNFSSLTSGQVGDQRGWKDASSTLVNEWNWTTSFGMNPSESLVESFEFSMTTPPGWVIEGTWPDGWEIGPTQNSSGYGPGIFHSGQNGAAVNLTTKYTNNIYTHLTTQEYSVPTNATARLSFRSWMCAEANWDGGGVSISTDGGQQWWWLPPQLNGFHDQISTVNTNSPLFGEGIIDGSSVPGGCSASNQRDFELKTYDLSNLSGQSLKARFSFFSDTYVEGDGWYIDDAGIEVDMFEPAGSWTSRAISPDPIFGYGWLDGWYERPEGTSLLFDVLDAQLNPIPDHQNMHLPAQLGLDPNEHPTVHIRVRMSTNDTYVTPLVHSLSVGRTTYIGPQHLLDSAVSSTVSTMDTNGTLHVAAPFSMPLPGFVACPHDGYRLTTVGDNLTWATTNGQLVASVHQPEPVKTTYLNHSLGGEIGLVPGFTLTATGGEAFVRAKAELDCVVPPLAPSLSLGLNNVSVMTWPPNNMDDHFGLNTRWSFAEHNGTDVLWAPNETAPSLSMHNSSLDLAFRTLSRFSQSVPGSQGPAFTLMVSNLSADTEVRIDGVLQNLAGHGSVVHHQASNPCPSIVSTEAYSSNRSLVSCAVRIDVQGMADVKVLNLMHLLPDTTVEVDMSADSLNTAKQASHGTDMRAVLDLPLHLNTERGGLRVAIGATAVPVMLEQVDVPSYTRWLPEETVSFTTHHTRLNPLDTNEDAPDITKVAFHLSPSPNLDDGVVHIEVDRIPEAPRFRTLGGAGLAQLDASASSVSCTLNTCTVQWVLTSTWLLDDMDDLHVLTMAQDDEGLEIGPVVYVRKTAFNEIENDLEVVDFTVTDVNQRRIDDWTNSFWPFHLNENQTLEAEGRVRMEGIANQWVAAGEAEATVTLTAVPPKNLSGGPDEWLSEPVNWSRAWTGEVTAGGWFSVALSTPKTDDALPSNTFFELRPSLSRRGPVDASASSSEDRTVVLTPTRFLHDTVSPQVNSLTVLDSGSEAVADGHVSMYGKDVALRLQLSDPEGLASQLEVWTWLERLHDTNGNGQMEQEEYSMQTVSLNRGVQQLEVDLPLLSSQSVVPDNKNAGRISVVLVGQDLAGNALEGGGDFGESNDLATISVQRRSDTTVDIDSLRLDTINDRLLAGHEHTLHFALGDANGIDSLDSLRLALLGESNESNCFIHYEPRFEGVDFDKTCFIETPTVHVSKRPLVTTYDVSVSFRLGWNASEGLAGGTPSLKVFDEGQDLGLGLYQLSGLSWLPTTEVEVRWMNITDTQAPFGENNASTYWFHRNDVVHHRFGVFHTNTDVLARDLPATGSFQWTLSDGERSENGNLNTTSTGVIEFNVSMNENVMYEDTGTFTVEPRGFDEREFQTLSYDLVVDDVAPKLVLEPGMLENLASNELEAVEVSLSINDDTDMPPGPLEMHAAYYRLGQPVGGTEMVFFLPLREVVNGFTVYNSTVNFLPADVELTRSDVLIVWFEAADRSGRSLTGYGTQNAPMNVGLTWYAFEPVLSDISATPFRPKVGENVSIYARIANDGLLSGEMNVILRDDEGRIMANETTSLSTGEWVNFVWNVEAWKEGRLGLNLEIVNHTPQVPVPLADIKAGEADDANSSMATLSLSALSLLVAAMVLFVVRQQRAQRQEAYHLERIRRIVSHRRPPPKPFDLVDIPQEE